MASMDVYDERRWLVTDDDDCRFNLWSKTAYASDFSRVNATLPFTLPPLLKDLLMAKNYTNKSAEEYDHDIHWEVTDMIIKAALFHRELDAKERREDRSGLGAESKAAAASAPAASAPAALVGGRYMRGGAQLTSDEAKALLANVYKKWDSLDSRSRTMYDAFINILDAENKEVLNKSAIATMTDSQLSQLRVNLKRQSPDGNTRFGATLPLLPMEQDTFGRIWYTKSDGTHVSQNVNAKDESNILSQIYEQTYQGHGLSGAPTTFAEAKKTDIKFFHIRVDDLVRKRLYAIAKAKPAEASAEEEKKKEEYIDCDWNVWRRNSKGEFVKNVGGKEVVYGVESDATKELLTANHKCYSTGVNATDAASCEKYIFNCLLNDDAGGLENCIKEFATNQDFFKAMKNEICDIHPLIALRTLQRFGFKKHKVYDAEAGCQINKVECRDHWLKNFMAKKFENKDLQEMITKNDKLLCYLEMLSQFVNSNPAILNKGFGGTTEEAVGAYAPTELARALGLQPRKEPKRGSSSTYELNLFKKHFDQYAVRNRQGPFQTDPLTGRVMTPFGTSLTPDVGLVIPLRPQTGGGHGIVDYALRKMNNEGMGQPVVGGRLIGELFAGLEKELRQRNKSLNPEDLKKVNERITGLIRDEETLLQTIAYIECYIDLMDKLGNYESKILNLSDLKRLMEKHMTMKNKHISHEQYMFKIFEQLEKLISQEDSGEYTPLTLNQ